MSWTGRGTHLSADVPPHSMDIAVNPPSLEVKGCLEWMQGVHAKVLYMQRLQLS